MGALAMFGMGEVTPNGIVKDTLLFNPEVLVIATASAFVFTSKHEVSQGVEVYLAGMWTIGSIVLYSMSGSKISLSVVSLLPDVLPLMLTGFVFRWLGCYFAVWGSRTLRAKGEKARLCYATFATLCSLPRSSIPSALGSSPIQERLFHSDPDRIQIREFISNAAKIYIVVCMIVGPLLLEMLGPKLLAASEFETSTQKEVADVESGSKQTLEQENDACDKDDDWDMADFSRTCTIHATESC